MTRQKRARQRKAMLMIFVGDDWAEEHHDVFLMSQNGIEVASKQLPEGIAGIAQLHEMVADAGITDPAEVVVGIETDRGLWVNALIGAGYQVHAINPASAAAYRPRHTISGAKSDRGDAKMLADIVRTDRHLHRLVPANSDHVETIRLLARAHQNLIWERSRHTNQLRSHLIQYFPTAINTFKDLSAPETLGLLKAGPTPKDAARLTKAKISKVLKQAGRQRNIERKTIEYQTALNAEQLEVSDLVADTFATITISMTELLTSINTQIEQIENALTESFKTHPDAEIYLSLPGVSYVTGARMLGEFGDNPETYTNAKSRRNAAGTSPLTDASGKKRHVTRRNARNKRLSTAAHTWASNARLNSPGARAFYQQRRTNGDEHNKALRALSNKLVGQLHGTLKTRTPYNEQTAWQHQQQQHKTKQAA